MTVNHNNYGYNKDLKKFARKLRRNSTQAEIRLWTELLRARKMKGFQFLRQRPVLNYIADFLCKDLMLIIEVDGITHDDEQQWREDLERQGELEEFGFTVLRFSDEEVMNDIDYVAQAITGWIEHHPPAHCVCRPPSTGDSSRK